MPAVQADAADAVLWPELQQVVTTTIDIGATAAPVPSSGGSQVPIGAIVGGTVGGAFLAIAAVVGWKWWGRSLKRAHEARQKEALAALKTRANTRRNSSSTSVPRSASYEPSVRAQSERKIKWSDKPSDFDARRSLESVARSLPPLTPAQSRRASQEKPPFSIASPSHSRSASLPSLPNGGPAEAAVAALAQIQDTKPTQHSRASSFSSLRRSMDGAEASRVLHVPSSPSASKSAQHSRAPPFPSLKQAKESSESRGSPPPTPSPQPVGAIFDPSLGRLETRNTSTSVPNGRAPTPPRKGISRPSKPLKSSLKATSPPALAPVRPLNVRNRKALTKGRRGSLKRKESDPTALATTAESEEQSVGRSQRPPRGPPPVSLRNYQTNTNADRSSTVSSGSLYSTQSGEEHRLDVPINLIMAAFGYDDSNLGHGVDDSAPSTSRRPTRTVTRKTSREQSTGEPLSRLSQVSAGSAALQPEPMPGLPIGVAFGGEVRAEGR